MYLHNICTYKNILKIHDGGKIQKKQKTEYFETRLDCFLKLILFKKITWCVKFQKTVARKRGGGLEMLSSKIAYPCFKTA